MAEIEAGRVGAEERSGGGTQRGATGTPGKGLLEKTNTDPSSLRYDISMKCIVITYHLN